MPDQPLSDAARRLRGRPGRKARPKLQAVDVQATGASAALPELPARTAAAGAVATPLCAPSWPSRPRLVSVQVAAWYISVSPYTLQDWLKAGLLPSIQID